MRLPLIVAAVLTGACATATVPTPTPASMDAVIANLVLRGVTVHQLVSGDPGCPGSDLHGNALYMELALPAQSALHPLYLFRWRRPADFDAAGQQFAECVTEYRALNPGATVGQVEVSPWRAYGPFWTDQLEQIVADALRQAAGG